MLGKWAFYIEIVVRIILSVSTQKNLESYKVIVDKKTGVNYLYIINETSGGLTALLDSEGKPIITKDK